MRIPGGHPIARRSSQGRHPPCFRCGRRQLFADHPETTRGRKKNAGTKNSGGLAIAITRRLLPSTSAVTRSGARLREPGPIERHSLSVARKADCAVDPIEDARHRRPALDAYREQTAGRILRALGRIQQPRTVGRECDPPVADDGCRHELESGPDQAGAVVSPACRRPTQPRPGADRLARWPRRWQCRSS